MGHSVLVFRREPRSRGRVRELLDVGVAIVVISWAAIATLQDWEEWVDVALGVWLAASPLVLAYADKQALAWNAMLVGAVVIVIAIWARYSRPSYALRERRRAS